MITVTNLIDETELLNNFQRFEINEEVNGLFTVSLASFSVHNNPGHELIEEESIITVDGYDFRVKQMKESHNRKDVTAISTFYDLTGHRQEFIYGGTRTFNEFATFAFADTGWTFSSSVTGSVLIPNYGEENVIKLVQALCQAFECDYKIMPNKHIHFAKEIGPDNDAQYRYGHNVQALSKSVDTTNMRTQITGHGGNGLVVVYTSPNATKYGIHKADPFSDDRFTVPASLTEKLKQELKDYPETSIELDSIELMDKELGERVWLIYEPRGIEFQTRVMSKKSVIRNGKLVTASVVIGNTVPRSLSDILTSQKVEIDENKKETKSKFEQTNDRITMEVETIGESIATLEIKAESITMSVSDLTGRVGSAEASIRIQSDEIALKVSRDGVIGAINISPENIKIQAKNINLVGAVNVLSDISGSLGTITAGVIRGTTFILDGGYLDLSLGSIFWGDNVPADALYARNAGNANLLNGLYTASDFSRDGHNHSNRYVHSNLDQNLRLHRDSSTGRIVVTENGINRGTLAWY